MCPQRDKEKDRCPHVSGNYDFNMCQPQTGLVVMNVSPEGQEERLVATCNYAYDMCQPQISLAVMNVSPSGARMCLAIMITTCANRKQVW